MSITSSKNEKVQWVLGQVAQAVHAKTLENLTLDMEAGTALDLPSLRRRLTDEVRPKLGMLSEDALQRIGSYGLGLGNDGYWEFGDDDFLEETQLQKAGLALTAGMSGNEFLREVAFTTIVALVWDILRQAEYHEAEHRRRRSYAIV